MKYLLAFIISTLFGILGHYLLIEFGGLDWKISCLINQIPIMIVYFFVLSCIE